MFRKSNIRIGPATPLAMIALFVSLSSVSFAAGVIGTADLENGAVTKKKLHKNAVATGKIRNGAVSTPKLRDEAVTGQKVVESTLGQVPSAASADQATQADTATSAEEADSAQTAAKVGPNGVDSAAIQTAAVGTSEIQNGSVGAADLGSSSVRSSELGPVVTRTETDSVPKEGGTGIGTPGCFVGEQMISGGASWGGANLSADAPFLRIAYSYPLAGSNWVARGYNGSAETRNFTVYVVCLDN